MDYLVNLPEIVACFFDFSYISEKYWIMKKIICLMCICVGVASFVYAKESTLLNLLDTIKRESVILDKKLVQTEKKISYELRDLELKQKEAILTRYSTELGILLSAFGVIFAAFTLGFPIYAIKVNKKITKHLEKGKTELSVKIAELEESAQAHIQERVQKIDDIYEDAQEVKKKLDALSRHNMDSIEIDEVNRANYRNQAENIELDEQATEIQKACANFYAKFYDGNYRGGIEQYDVIIDKYKGEIAVSEVDKLDYYVGLCYYKLGKYKQSLTFLKRYNKITENVRCWYYLANCYLQLKEYHLTIKFFNQCLEDDSIKADKRILDNVQSGLGIAYLEIKDYDKALHYFRDALNTHEDIEDYINIAKVFICKAQHDRFLMDEEHVKEAYQEGIAILQKGLKQCSLYLDVKSFVSVYTILGEIYLALNDYIKALNCFKEILKKEEGNLTAWLNILQIYREFETIDLENRTTLLFKAKQLMNA